MKVILPVAGTGTRLRPFTLTRPKCLLSIAGKTLLEHICDSFKSLSVSGKVLVAGYLSDCIEDFVKTKNWQNTDIILQKNPQGLGEAISLCMPIVSDEEPLLIILGDTLFEADLSFLANAETNVLLTRKVKDPRRFGVAVKDADGKVVKLVEKTQEFVSDEALVGIYYIKDVALLRKSLNYLLENDIRTRGEFQLTDALQKMVEDGADFRTSPLTAWLDCGTPETLLETNGTVLQKSTLAPAPAFPDTKIIQPCYIGQNVEISGSTIGPNVTVDDGVKIKDSVISDSLIGCNTVVESSNIKLSVLGESASVRNMQGRAFIGDNTIVEQEK